MARRPEPRSPETAVATADWDRFVERSGVATVVAFLLVILSLSSARWNGSAAADALAGPRLLLLLVVLGCIAVLSYRRDPS